MELVGDFEYNKKDLIGHGAFAVVFKGRARAAPDHTVAVKCITKKNLAKSQSLLSKEIKILKELSSLSHENVVGLLDCKETSRHVYLVMEYCNGGDLADYLQTKGTLTEDTIAMFLRQIAGAMKALFAKGIVHRDLKPQNILLCHSGKRNHSPADIKLKIADFGFARFLQDGVMAATLCGSPMYMAPEVIMSLQYDAKADLWSVGTIVYQCLTGKAPFQAQTPQQLKHHYEKNVNLQPNIPSGTSAELKDLLLKLLKRNARDRIHFDDFFKHPFLHPKTAKSYVRSETAPVPVPRSRSRSSIGDSPPVKPISASPLSGNIPISPSNCGAAAAGRQSGQEPMEMGSPPEAGGFFKVDRTDTAAGQVDPEDYVLVPENLPSDNSASSVGSGQRHGSSAELSEISEERLSNGNGASKRVHASPQGGNITFNKTDAVFQTSPSRPSTLQVQSPTSPPSSQPIPVPSQARAHAHAHKRSSNSPQNKTPSPTPSPSSPKHVWNASPGTPRGMPIPKRASVPHLGSMSPPAVQFTIGTPPSGSRRRTMTPPSCSSPHRKNSASPLPPILGSPAMNSRVFQFPQNDNFMTSPTSPLQTPFGNFRSRTRTCPDNIGAVGYKTDSHRVSLVPYAEAGSSEHLFFERSGSTGRFSEQLVKAAFGSHASSPPQNMPAHPISNPIGNLVVPFGGSTSSMQQGSSSGSLRDRSGSLGGRHRRFSGNDDMNPTSTHCTAPSPPNMEGPIMFVAPELAEDILMEKVHNETVNKLRFVLALVECILELAQSRSSPINESLNEKEVGTFTLDHISFVSESQRCMEQLVLYVRALQLLSSSIQLTRDEMEAGRLQSCNTVQLVLKEMNNHYHQCLNVCKYLHNKGVLQHRDVQPQAASITADRLIYSYAIEMCQTAALDELFGNPQECFRRYRNAQILLHSLTQQAEDETDKQLLNKYKESVERRLFILHGQGYINVHESSAAS